MTPQPEWIDKAQAAKRLGLSERSVLRLAVTGKLKHIRIAGRYNRKVMFSAADVERFAYERDNPQAAASVPAPLIRPHTPAEITGLERLQMAIGLAHNGHQDAAQAVPKPWMTLTEAAAFSGLPKHTLERLMKAGKLPVLYVGTHSPGGRYRVKRSDVENLAGEVITR